MSKGYVTIAQNSGDIDYIRMAYALALSIKATQSTINKLSILVTEGTLIQPRYQDAFDKIIEMPWGDDAQNKDWKVNNKWKYIYTTPYTETIALDADMIFLSDISAWWNFLSKKGVWICTNARTFRNELITSDYYRKTFTINNLPNVYTAFFYFNKDSQIAWDLFNYVEHIFHNGKTFFDEFLVPPKPKWFSADVAYAMAIKLIDIEDECTSKIFGYPSFIHMKSMLQNVKVASVTDNWLEHFPTYFTDDLSLKIGNHKQYLPFHYHKKEWLTEDIIQKLEKKVYG